METIVKGVTRKRTMKTKLSTRLIVNIKIRYFEYK